MDRTTRPLVIIAAFASSLVVVLVVLLGATVFVAYIGWKFGSGADVPPGSSLAGARVGGPSQGHPVD